MTTLEIEVGDRLFAIISVILVMALGQFFTKTLLYLIGEANLPIPWKKRRKQNDYAA